MVFAGCGRKEESKNLTIRFLNDAPQYAAMYENAAKSYREEKGINVITETASADYSNTLETKLNSSTPPTIFIISGYEEYEKRKNDSLNLGGNDIAGLLTDKSLGIVSEDGIFAVPYEVKSFGFIYNEKIMNTFFALPDRETDISSAEEIKGFSDFKEVVEEMNQKREELGIEAVFAPLPLKEGEREIWQTHLLNIPLCYELKDAGLDEGSSAEDFKFVYAENFKNIFDLYAENSVKNESESEEVGKKDSAEAFAAGKCAMMLGTSDDWEDISVYRSEDVSEDDIRMAPVYTGIENESKQGLSMGTESYLAVNKNAPSEERDAALDFLNWLFSSDEGKKQLISAGIVTPFNSFAKEDVPKNPLAKETYNWLGKEGLETMSWKYEFIPQEKREKFGAALALYANGGADWESVKRTLTE